MGLRRQGDGVRAPLLATEDLQVRFKARRAWQGRREKRLVRAVDGVSFEIERGRTLGVVGESGSGKTTIARAIVGLTPLTEGDVRLGEQRLAARVRARPRGVLKELQMVFQNPDASLNPVRTVGEAIARPLVLLQGMGREQAAARGRELLRAVSLPETYFDRVPSELSGGEKQRVAIARAFAADPGIILCDEPISSLDVSVQGSLMNLLMQLQAERETSYMFISHDLSAVQHLSDEIIVVYLGRIVESGPAASVLSPPYHPYTEALLSAVPIAEPDLPRTPLRLGGSVPSAMDVPPGCRFHPRCPRVLGSICAEQEPPWQEGEGAIRICCHIPLRELVRLQAEAAGDAQTKGTH